MYLLVFHPYLLSLHFVHSTFHIKRLLVLCVVFSIKNLCEPAHCIGKSYVLAFSPSEGFCDRERLREETLYLARAIDKLFVVFGKFLDTQNGNDVLQVFVALQHAAGFVGDTIVLFTDDFGCVRRGARFERINSWVNTQRREGA